MITAADFMRFPTEDRAVALGTFREHLARLLLAEATMLIRAQHPTAAWIRVRFPSDVVSQLSGTVDLVSIRDAGGYAVGRGGPKLAAESGLLLRDVQHVCPSLLGRSGPDGPCVVRVDLPPVPGDD